MGRGFAADAVRNGAVCLQGYYAVMYEDEVEVAKCSSYFEAHRRSSSAVIRPNSKGTQPMDPSMS